MKQNQVKTIPIYELKDGKYVFEFSALLPVKHTVTRKI